MLSFSSIFLCSFLSISPFCFRFGRVVSGAAVDRLQVKKKGKKDESVHTPRRFSSREKSKRKWGEKKEGGKTCVIVITDVTQGASALSAVRRGISARGRRRRRSAARASRHFCDGAVRGRGGDFVRW